MKLRIRLRDTLELILTGNYREFQKQYSLSRRKLRSLERALKSGNWRIVEGWGE